jgi:hypothetical protein
MVISGIATLTSAAQDMNSGQHPTSWGTLDSVAVRMILTTKQETKQKLLNGTNGPKQQ